MDVVVHGGAGSVPDDPPARASVLHEAAIAGSRAPTPVAAVRSAIRTMEADPRFNAGIGGCVQSDGRIRVDAGLMTASRDVGAVAAVPGVCHAIDLADAVRTETPHVMLAGREAVQFAAHCGIETDVDLWSDETRERWADEQLEGADVDAQLRAVQNRFGGAHDTVGAVATDGREVAAGTSTAGRWMALAGRVGDVPQVGCGYYATASGGASATGAGEDIARGMLAREAIDRLEAGASPSIAAREVIETFDTDFGTDAGIIVLNGAGEAGVAFASEAMQTCVASDGTLTRPVDDHP